MNHIYYAGEFDEYLVVVEEMSHVEGIMDSAGGHVRLRAGKPHFTGAMIVMKNGMSIPVPQTPAELEDRIREASIRKTILPS